MKKIIGLLIGVCIFGYSFAQADFKPTHIVWKADGKEVSLKSAYDTGIDRPEELGLSVFFSNDLLKKYSKDDFTLEFRWFYYYSTTKEFMNKQVIPYDKLNETSGNLFSVSSVRKNIRSGWWEVIVTAKYNNEPVEIEEVKRFQIYVK